MGHKTRKTSQVLGRFKRQSKHLVLNLRGAGEPAEWARMTALTASLQETDAKRQETQCGCRGSSKTSSGGHCLSFGQTCKAHEGGTAGKRWQEGNLSGKIQESWQQLGSLRKKEGVEMGLGVLGLIPFGALYLQ